MSGINPIGITISIKNHHDNIYKTEEPVADQNNTLTLEVEDTSCLRVACIWAHKVLNMIRTGLGLRHDRLNENRITTKNIEKFYSEEISEVNFEKWNDINGTINTLRSQVDFGSGGTNHYCQYLKRQHPNVRFVDNCLVKRPDTTDQLQNLPDFPGVDDKSPIMIPIVLNDKIVDRKNLKIGKDHIVAMYITFDSKGVATIEFYDSKGLTISQRLNDKFAYNDNKLLKNIIKEITVKYCKKGVNKKVIENTHMDQYDCHNCGVLVCNYFEKRLQGVKPKKISSQCTSYNSTFSMHTRMADNLAFEWNRKQSIRQRIEYIIKESIRTPTMPDYVKWLIENDPKNPNIAIGIELLFKNDPRNSEIPKFIEVLLKERPKDANIPKLIERLLDFRYYYGLTTTKNVILKYIESLNDHYSQSLPEYIKWLLNNDAPNGTEFPEDIRNIMDIETVKQKYLSEKPTASRLPSAPSSDSDDEENDEFEQANT